MAYNQFSIADLSQKLGLRIVEVDDLFAKAPPASASALLTDYLREGAPLALEMSTEKARSEMIITPILLEVRRQRGREVSLFSGMEFDVEPARGLTGYCDFLLSLSPTQIEIQAPVVAIVEAKNENIRQGIPQCAAEMYASRLFNEQRGASVPVLFGAVTTGSAWRFLRLRDTTLEVDLREYYLDAVERILGVLTHMLAVAQASHVAGSRA